MHDRKGFLLTIRPFERLSEAELTRAVAALDILFIPEQEQVTRAGDAPEFLYILYKGMVRAEEAEGIVAIYGPSEYFDPGAMISGVSTHDFIVTEEVVCFTLPRQVFMDLVKGNQRFQDYFFQNLSQKIANLREENGCQDLNPLITGRIKDLDLRPALIIDGHDSIHRAAGMMRENRTDALLVKLSPTMLGLVTGTDIRDAVAGECKDPLDPVSHITRQGVPSAMRDDFLFNAMLAMTKHQVSRLLIEQNGEPVGFLELVDLLGFISNHSHLVLNRINRATSLEELREAAERLPFTMRNLYFKGVKVRYVARLMRELNRNLLIKLYSLLAPPELATQTALVVMGSEGRGEQLLATDQDNALLVRDGFSHPELEQFRSAVANALKQLGYHACPGGIMIDQVGWCAPVTEFKEHLHSWIHEGSPEGMMRLAVFYDAATVAGDTTLLGQVKKHMFSLLPDDLSFYARFAHPTLAFDTPLGWFSQFVLDGSEQELDIKKGGLFPIVHGVRSLALEQHLTEVNTGKRIRALTRKGVFDASFADDLIEAFDFMSGIRFQGMLERGTGNPAQENLIAPAQLSSWQRELLKDSLRTVNRLKKFVVHHFRLNLMG